MVVYPVSTVDLLGTPSPMGKRPWEFLVEPGVPMGSWDQCSLTSRSWGWTLPCRVPSWEHHLQQAEPMLDVISSYVQKKKEKSILRLVGIYRCFQWLLIISETRLKTVEIVEIEHPLLPPEQMVSGCTHRIPPLEPRRPSSCWRHCQDLCTRIWVFGSAVPMSSRFFHHDIF